MPEPQLYWKILTKLTWVGPRLVSFKFPHAGLMCNQDRKPAKPQELSDWLWNARCYAVVTSIDSGQVFWLWENISKCLGSWLPGTTGLQQCDQNQKQTEVLLHVLFSSFYSEGSVSCTISAPLLLEWQFQMWYCLLVHTIVEPWVTCWPRSLCMREAHFPLKSWLLGCWCSFTESSSSNRSSWTSSKN
jgi:hypothetical protein